MYFTNLKFNPTRPPNRSYPIIFFVFSRKSKDQPCENCENKGERLKFCGVKPVLEKIVKWKRQASTLVALIISQLLFSAVHIPGWMSANFGQERLIFKMVDTMAMGMFFMVGYLRTQSLFVPIRMHALLNYGVPLFSGATYEATFYLASYFILVLYFLWPKFVQNRNDT
ncbi:CPBP family intramembrane glutamic endopeptidase [Brevibacillus gelatini]